MSSVCCNSFVNKFYGSFSPKINQLELSFFCFKKLCNLNTNVNFLYSKSFKRVVLSRNFLCVFSFVIICFIVLYTIVKIVIQKLQLFSRKEVPSKKNIISSSFPLEEVSIHSFMSFEKFVEDNKGLIIVTPNLLKLDECIYYDMITEDCLNVKNSIEALDCFIKSPNIQGTVLFNALTKKHLLVKKKGSPKLTMKELNDILLDDHRMEFDCNTLCHVYKFLDCMRKISFISLYKYCFCLLGIIKSKDKLIKTSTMLKDLYLKIEDLEKHSSNLKKHKICIKHYEIAELFALIVCECFDDVNLRKKQTIIYKTLHYLYGGKISPEMQSVLRNFGFKYNFDEYIYPKSILKMDTSFFE